MLEKKQLPVKIKRPIRKERPHSKSIFKELSKMYDEDDDDEAFLAKKQRSPEQIAHIKKSNSMGRRKIARFLALEAFPKKRIFRILPRESAYFNNYTAEALKAIRKSGFCTIDANVPDLNFNQSVTFTKDDLQQIDGLEQVRKDINTFLATKALGEKQAKGLSEDDKALFDYPVEQVLDQFEKSTSATVNLKFDKLKVNQAVTVTQKDINGPWTPPKMTPDVRERRIARVLGKNSLPRASQKRPLSFYETTLYQPYIKPTGKKLESFDDADVDVSVPQLGVNTSVNVSNEELFQPDGLEDIVPLLAKTIVAKSSNPPKSMNDISDQVAESHYDLADEALCKLLSAESTTIKTRTGSAEITRNDIAGLEAIAAYNSKIARLLASKALKKPQSDISPHVTSEFNGYVNPVVQQLKVADSATINVTIPHLKLDNKEVTITNKELYQLNQEHQLQRQVSKFLAAKAKGFSVSPSSVPDSEAFLYDSYAQDALSQLKNKPTADLDVNILPLGMKKILSFTRPELEEIEKLMANQKRMAKLLASKSTDPPKPIDSIQDTQIALFDPYSPDALDQLNKKKVATVHANIPSIGCNKTITVTKAEFDNETMADECKKQIRKILSYKCNAPDNEEEFNEYAEDAFRQFQTSDTANVAANIPAIGVKAKVSIHISEINGLDKIRSLHPDTYKPTAIETLDPLQLPEDAKPLVIHMEIQDDETLFGIIPSDTIKEDSVPHIVFHRGRQCKVPNFPDIMFKSANEHDIKDFARNSEFQIIEDPKTKLAAFKHKDMPYSILTCQNIVKQICAGVQKICQEKYGGVARKALVVIPNLFSSIQRKDLHDSLKLGGLREIIFIESTDLIAAALSTIVKGKKKVLIGNWTNTSFEAAVGKVGEGVADVVDKVGKSAIGLDLVKGKICRLIASKVIKPHVAFEYVTDEQASLFMPYCKQVILDLLKDEETTLNVVVDSPIINTSCVITRDEVEDFCGNPFSTISDLLAKMIAKHKDIEATCFNIEGMEVDGQTFARMRRELGVDHLENILLDNRHLAASFQGLEDGSIVLVPRLMFSIHTNNTYDRVSTLFPRNAKLPKTVKKTWVTVQDYQKNFTFEFCEGERKRFSTNAQFGVCEVTIDNKYRCLARQLSVVAKYSIDVNGILNVDFYYNKETEPFLTFNKALQRDSQGVDFNPDEILADAEKYAEEDQREIRIVCAKDRLRHSLTNASIRIFRKYNIKGIPDIQVVKDKIKELQDWFTAHPDEPLEEYTQRYDDFLLLANTGEKPLIDRVELV